MKHFLLGNAGLHINENFGGGRYVASGNIVANLSLRCLKRYCTQIFSWHRVSSRWMQIFVL